MKYWAYINGEVPGCYPPEELLSLPHFSPSTLVCPAEGEILEQNWRKAAEVSDIAAVLAARESRRREAAVPAEPPETADQLNPSLAAGDIERLIDDSGAKLFSHVTDLMKELENRREEHSQGLSLRRQVGELKEQLRDARDAASRADDLDGRIRNLEAKLKESQASADALQASLTAKDGALGELRVKLETTKLELENVSRRHGEAANDLAIRNRLVESLSRQMTEKEIALAKALALIRRFEEELARLRPAKPAEAGPAIVPVAVPVSSVPKTVPVVSELPAKTISGTEFSAPASPEPSSPPPDPTSVPEAQGALRRFLRKHFGARPQS